MPLGALATTGQLETESGSYPALTVAEDEQMLHDTTVNSSYWDQQGYEPWSARHPQAQKAVSQLLNSTQLEGGWSPITGNLQSSSISHSPSGPVPLTPPLPSGAAAWAGQPRRVSTAPPQSRPPPPSPSRPPPLTPSHSSRTRVRRIPSLRVITPPSGPDPAIRTSASAAAAPPLGGSLHSAHRFLTAEPAPAQSPQERARSRGGLGSGSIPVGAGPGVAGITAHGAWAPGCDPAPRSPRSSVAVDVYGQPLAETQLRDSPRRPYTPSLPPDVLQAWGPPLGGAGPSPGQSPPGSAARRERGGVAFGRRATPPSEGLVRPGSKASSRGLGGGGWGGQGAEGPGAGQHTLGQLAAAVDQVAKYAERHQAATRHGVHGLGQLGGGSRPAAAPHRPADPRPLHPSTTSDWALLLEQNRNRMMQRIDDVTTLLQLPSPSRVPSLPPPGPGPGPSSPTSAAPTPGLAAPTPGVTDPWIQQDWLRFGGASNGSGVRPPGAPAYNMTPPWGQAGPPITTLHPPFAATSTYPSPGGVAGAAAGAQGGGEGWVGSPSPGALQGGRGGQSGALGLDFDADVLPGVASILNPGGRLRAQRSFSPSRRSLSPSKGAGGPAAGVGVRSVGEGSGARGGGVGGIQVAGSALASSVAAARAGGVQPDPVLRAGIGGSSGRVQQQQQQQLGVDPPRPPPLPGGSRAGWDTDSPLPLPSPSKSPASTDAASPAVGAAEGVEGGADALYFPPLQPEVSFGSPWSFSSSMPFTPPGLGSAPGPAGAPGLWPPSRPASGHPSSRGPPPGQPLDLHSGAGAAAGHAASSQGGWGGEGGGVTLLPGRWLGQQQLQPRGGGWGGAGSGHGPGQAPGGTRGLSPEASLADLAAPGQQQQQLVQEPSLNFTLQAEARPAAPPPPAAAAAAALAASGGKEMSSMEALQQQEQQRGAEQQQQQQAGPDLSLHPQQLHAARPDPAVNGSHAVALPDQHSGEGQLPPDQVMGGAAGASRPLPRPRLGHCDDDEGGEEEGEEEVEASLQEEVEGVEGEEAQSSRQTGSGAMGRGREGQGGWVGTQGEGAGSVQGEEVEEEEEEEGEGVPQNPVATAGLGYTLVTSAAVPLLSQAEVAQAAREAALREVETGLDDPTTRSRLQDGARAARARTRMPGLPLGLSLGATPPLPSQEPLGVSMVKMATTTRHQPKLPAATTRVARDSSPGQDRPSASRPSPDRPSLSRPPLPHPSASGPPGSHPPAAAAAGGAAQLPTEFKHKQGVTDIGKAHMQDIWAGP